MQANSLKNRINFSHAKALRRAREMLKLTRNEMALKLQVSPETVKKYEVGRAIIDEEKVDKFISILNLSREDYEKIRKGKGIGLLKRTKKVQTNEQRRSYQKVISKEVRVLKIMRQIKKISQDQASALCGYSRPTIGHIENGRIELPDSRIRHIVLSYGLEMNYFYELMKEEILRDELLQVCVDKIKQLPEEKLKIVSSLLKSF